MKILARAEWPGRARSPIAPPPAAPDLSFIPAMMRRRLTPLERAALYVAHAVLTSPAAQSTSHQAPGTNLPIVFASRWGEIGTTLKLMRQQHEEGEISPAGFSNSVHNALPGVLSLLLHDTAPYTAIAAGPDTRAMGLLEASAYPGRVLFIYAEEATPEFYRAEFADQESTHAEALLIDNGRLPEEVAPHGLECR